MANTHRQGHCEDPRKQDESAASKTRQGKRWVAQGKTVSAFPPEGLFTKSAATIAKSLVSKKVSPKGAASGMRMPNSINRCRTRVECGAAGRNRRKRKNCSPAKFKKRRTREKQEGGRRDGIHPSKMNVLHLQHALLMLEYKAWRR